MKRVLLTGADGYIGRSVQDSLRQQDFEIHAISRTPKHSDPSVHWHTVDLFDPTAVDTLLSTVACSHLIHLAWVTEPGAYWQSPDNARWQVASLELLKSFAAHGGERAMLAGTCAEYDWNDGHCVEETTPLNAQSPYTGAKLALREASAEFAKSAELDLVWARVFFSFGPNEHPERLVPAVIRALLSGERASCSDGEQLRDFMYVRDMADAFVAVLQSGFSGDINIASGDAMTIKGLVTRIAKSLGATDQVDFGARLRQAGDPDRITADVSRLSDIVGWKPKRTMQSAIDETIAWWRQQQTN